MSDPEERPKLREMAANRGCRLIVSRKRTPGRGDYGRYGLKDAKSGKPVLGIGKKGLTATADEIEAFLRGGSTTDWKRSLGAMPPPKKAQAAARPSKKVRKAPPEASIRDARPADAPAIAALLAELGYEASAAEVKKRLAALKRGGEPVLVAAADVVIGAASIHGTPTLHRPHPVGRITLLVVAENRRGEGVGARLVAEAEARLAARGCGMVEVTSNRRRLRAHAFYERLGYQRTSYRFAKDMNG